MKRSVKRYKLNEDFAVECETIEGEYKIYNIRVIQISVPFYPVLEKKEGILYPDDANNVFKHYLLKYKYGIRG